jgi:hypothetical protein
MTVSCFLKNPKRISLNLGEKILVINYDSALIKMHVTIA